MEQLSPHSAVDLHNYGLEIGLRAFGQYRTLPFQQSYVDWFQ